MDAYECSADTHSRGVAPSDSLACIVLLRRRAHGPRDRPRHWPRRGAMAAWKMLRHWPRHPASQAGESTSLAAWSGPKGYPGEGVRLQWKGVSEID